ncbi:MAG: aldose 1-epimerase [Armatimonadota bacterium]
MGLETIDKYEVARGSHCFIAREWGCNLISWVVQDEEIMYCPPELPLLATKITGGGNPILFPSVGRTWDLSGDEPKLGPYRVYGSERMYHLPNHGIVFKSKFELTGVLKSPYLVTAVYVLSIPEEVRNQSYPFDVRLVQSFTLKPSRIDLWARITNYDSRPAPVAFGYHPYFRISSPTRKGVEVRLPATKELVLTRDTVLPTGETKDFDGILRLSSGKDYDNAYVGITGRRASLIDRKAKRILHIDFDQNTEILVVYAPDSAEFVCIEPWTKGLGAFMHLNNPDWEKTEKVRILQPGETMSFSVAFIVE